MKEEDEVYRDNTLYGSATPSSRTKSGQEPKGLERDRLQVRYTCSDLEDRQEGKSEMTSGLISAEL